MSSSKNSLSKIEEIFATYLEDNNYRKTPERFTILREIYSRNDHFDAESLYLHIKNKELGISRATVYNTLDLLLACDLVIKQQFGKKQAKFEKAHGFKQHDHIICTNCKKVIEFCDPRLQKVQDKMEELFNFKINYHSLNLYGLCEECQQAKQEREQRASASVEEN